MASQDLKSAFSFVIECIVYPGAERLRERCFPSAVVSPPCTTILCFRLISMKLRCAPHLRLAMEEVWKEGELGDCSLVCSDATITLPRLLLALSSPSLHLLLATREREEHLTLLLPHHSKQEITTNLQRFLSSSKNNEYFKEETSHDQKVKVTHEPTVTKPSVEVKEELDDDFDENEVEFEAVEEGFWDSGEKCLPLNSDVSNAKKADDNAKKQAHAMLAPQRFLKTIEEPLVCPLCDKKFTSSSDLLEHKQMYVSGLSWRCPQPGCSKTYKGSCLVPFINHLKEHQGRLDFSCAECGKQFATKTYLRTHTRDSHGPGFSCDQCGQTLATKARLKSHTLVFHTDKRDFPCAECGSLFKTLDTMKNHVRFVHQKEKAFECSYCTKPFATRNKLKRHESIHTGSMPYSCSKCGKAFNQKVNMTTHEAKCHST